jgi:hypothetical protein
MLGSVESFKQRLNSRLLEDVQTLKYQEMFRLLQIFVNFAEFFVLPGTLLPKNRRLQKP